MQGVMIGDRIALILSLLIPAGLVVAYFASLMLDRYSPVGICQRADITYGLLAALGFVGFVLTLNSAGFDWLNHSLLLVGAPVLISLAAFDLFAGKGAGETTQQVFLLATFVAMASLAWLGRSGPDRLSIVGLATGTTLGWLILERKKSFLPRKDGMVWVRLIEDI